MDSAHFIIALCVLAAILLVPGFCAVWFACALFSARRRETIRKHWMSHAILAVASLAIVWMLFSNSVYAVPYLTSAKMAHTKAVTLAIRDAILAYEIEYDRPPASLDNAAIMRILRGENERKLTFIELQPNEINAKGEAVDAWGNPFQFSFADPKHPAILSTMLLSSTR